MAVENETKSIDEVIGEGADAGPGSKPEAESAQPSGPAGDASADREPNNWTYAALKDERGKRQALQERTAELEAQLAATQHRPANSVSDQFWENPDAVFGQFQKAAMNATLRASRAEHIASNGRAEFDQMEAAVGAAMAAGNPDMAILREAMIQSDDPVSVAMSWYRSTGGGAPRRRAMPSNFASARNVGARSGPAWSGPTPLDDIFDRGRK